MNLTAICILNYNNGAKTVRCMASVLAQTSPDYRILVVDNGSTDDSLATIHDYLLHNHLAFRWVEPSEHFHEAPPQPGEILIVKASRNGGYSSGNNLGIRLAQSLKIFSHLLVINNDVILKENFLEVTIARYEGLILDTGATRLALGATELGENGKLHHRGFHYLHLVSGIPFPAPLFPSFPYIVGSCIFLPIDAPLFDESFFLYFDDTRYAKILLKQGFLLQNSPDSIFTHEVGGTKTHRLQWQLFKSLRRFYLLHYPLLLPVTVPIRLMLIFYLRIKALF
jgi:GT2 family glycosyltransferase